MEWVSESLGCTLPPFAFLLLLARTVSVSGMAIGSVVLLSLLSLFFQFFTPIKEGRNHFVSSKQCVVCPGLECPALVSVACLLVVSLLSALARCLPATCCFPWYPPENSIDSNKQHQLLAVVSRRTCRSHPAVRVGRNNPQLSPRRRGEESTNRTLSKTLGRGTRARCSWLKRAQLSFSSKFPREPRRKS